MSESFSNALPALSPDFDRVRKLSRFMAVIFTIAFWFAVLAAVGALATPLDPIIERGGHGGIGHGVVGINDLTISLEGLSVGQCVWVALALEIVILPLVFLTHHARRVFGHFARGEIFVLPVIGHIRNAGGWLIVSASAPVASQLLLNLVSLSHGQSHGTLWPLIIGLTTFIAASIMAEARRIADDNASIV